MGWGSVPCGPDVAIDVGADLRAIRVVDRYTGGCDTSGEWHDVVLQARGGDPIEAEEILSETVD